MISKTIPFQYKSNETTAGLTGFAGLPLYVELAKNTGLLDEIETKLHIKQRGWTDADIILALILINLAGGDCIIDIEQLENDGGLRKILLKIETYGMKRSEKREYERRWAKEKTRALPSNAAIHRFLAQFHCEAEEKNRRTGKAFIPKPNEHLQALCDLNQPLINSMNNHSPLKEVTLDQDATLVETNKRNAFFCYKHFKSFQPLNTYLAEHGIILYSEFRDGNVNAGFQQLRNLQESMERLPGSVTKVSLRSDSAGYQEDLIKYCGQGMNLRFGIIDFAIASKVSQGIKDAAIALKKEEWHTLYKTDDEGKTYQTNQEWAEIVYIPDWSVTCAETYRYLVIREKMSDPKKTEGKTLPFQTITTEGMTYKLFSIVTNLTIDGNAIIQWHRARCGASEQVHSEQKKGLAGGQFPSNKFGVNAAWWQIMVLSYNLNQLMKSIALPESYKNKEMKAMRFSIIQLPGCLINHARQYYMNVTKSAESILNYARSRIADINIVGPPAYG